MTTLRALLVLAALPFAACSCEEDPLAPRLPGTCEPDFDCGSSAEYRLGECRAQRCLADTDCCPGQTCNAALGLCINEYENKACSDDSACDVAGQTCITFRGGRFCGYANKDNTLTSAGTQRCDNDAQCDEGKTCFGHRCLVAAPCEGGCADGFICELDSNTCYEAPACTEVCGAGQIKIVADSDTMSGSQCCAIVCACETLPGIPEGTYGWYAAAALKSRDEVLVSAYDPNYGDLVVATFDGAGVQKGVAYVDGFPTSGPVIGNPDGLRGGRVDRGQNVGLHTAIAVDAGGIAHVAYYDKDAGALKYANDSGGLWKSVVVDDEGDTGYYTSIAVGPDGFPRIAYMMVNGTLAPDPTPVTALKVATARTNLPLSASDWATQVVESAAKPTLVCGGGCAPGTACVDFGMGAACAPTAATCGACPSGEVCVDNAGMAVCEARIPTIPVDDLIDGTGLFASLAIATDGSLAIAYYDRLQGDLRYAESDGSGTTWTIRTLDGNDTMTPTDVGQHVSLAFGANGTRGVAYVDATNDDLVFYDLVTMTREVVDNGVTPPNLRLVGADAALVFDDTGSPAIAYQDPTNIDLLHARRLGAPPMWSIEVLRGGPPAGMMDGTAAGFYVDQVKDGTRAFVTSVDVGFTEDGDVTLEVVVTPKALD